jgi:hypothetical protein
MRDRRDLFSHLLRIVRVAADRHLAAEHDLAHGLGKQSLARTSDVGVDQEQQSRLKRLFMACGWNTLPDVTLDSFSRWRESSPTCGGNAGKRGCKASGKTLNQYLEAARAFGAWCVKRKRIGRIRWLRLSDTQKLMCGLVEPPRLMRCSDFSRRHRRIAGGHTWPGLSRAFGEQSWLIFNGGMSGLTPLPHSFSFARKPPRHGEAIQSH